MRIVSTSEPQDLYFHKRPMDGTCHECVENLARNHARMAARCTCGATEHGMDDWHFDTCATKYPFASDAASKQGK